jgi:uncharacterized membrane protein
MEAFSDGVIAIAATLLILELGIDTPADLTHQWPAYVAYATSFITIGIIWMNHHTIVSCMRGTDRTLLFLNLLLLLTIAFLPLPTRLVAKYLNAPGEQSAVYAYAATFVVMALIYNILWRYARTRRRLIREDVPDARLRAIDRAFDPGVPLYGVTLGLAFLSPIASVFLTFAIAAFYLPSAALFERVSEPA